MRRAVFIALLLPAPAAIADDLSVRALLGYQAFDAGTFETAGFVQTYDVRFERALAEPFRLRLSLRAQRNDGRTDDGLARRDSTFSQLQPGGELTYMLPRLQLQALYDLARLDSTLEGRSNGWRGLERRSGRLSWTPDGLPSLMLQTERRHIEDVFAGLDRVERLDQGGLTYELKGLTASVLDRRTRLEEPLAGFTRRSHDLQGALDYDAAPWGGRLSVTANAAVVAQHHDDVARAGGAEAPTPVAITRALYARDETPLDSRDQPASPLPALRDGNLERGVGISLGPRGVSFHNLVADLGRSAEVNLFRIHVRDPQGGLVRVGGPLTWDVYVSLDGERWAAVPREQGSFVAALGAYEVRCQPRLARYFKVVSFGTNVVEADVTELEAFELTPLEPGEARSTDMLMGSGALSVSGRPRHDLTLSYSGLFNGLHQDATERPRITSRTLEHQVAAVYDPWRTVGFEGRYQRRTLAQSDLRDVFEAVTAIVRLALLRDLEQRLELTQGREDHAGQHIDTRTAALHTFSRPLPAIQLWLDVGAQRQDFVNEGYAVDRRFLNGVAAAQVLATLRLTLNASFSRSTYDLAVVEIVPAILGVPPARDDRWTAELYYRPNSQLGLAVRYGRATANGFSATLQRYHADWYPFRDGSVTLAGTFDQDVDSIGHRRSRRLTLSPAWRMNRHATLNVSYALLTLAGDAQGRTESFAVTLTLAF